MARDTVLRGYARGVELSAAALCLELDCNTVFDRSAGERCPRCGGAESYPLAVWLDRERDRLDRRPRGPSIESLIASTAA
jgi:hypothetical protein